MYIYAYNGTLCSLIVTTYILVLLMAKVSAFRIIRGILHQNYTCYRILLFKIHQKYNWFWMTWLIDQCLINSVNANRWKIQIFFTIGRHNLGKALLNWADLWYSRGYIKVIIVRNVIFPQMKQVNCLIDILEKLALLLEGWNGSLWMTPI